MGKARTLYVEVKLEGTDAINQDLKNVEASGTTAAQKIRTAWETEGRKIINASEYHAYMAAQANEKIEQSAIKASTKTYEAWESASKKRLTEAEYLTQKQVTLEEEMAQASEDAAARSEAAYNKAGQAITRMGEKAKRVGSVLTRYVTLPIVAMGVAAVAMTKDVLGSEEAIGKLSVEGQANAAALQASFDTLTGQIEVLKLEVVEGVMPVFTQLIDQINSDVIPILIDLAERWGDQSTAAKNAQIAILAITATTGPVVSWVADITIAIGGLIILLNSLKNAAILARLAVLGIPLGIVGAAVGAGVYLGLTDDPEAGGTSPSIMGTVGGQPFRTPYQEERAAEAAGGSWGALFGAGITGGRAVTMPRIEPGSMTDFWALSAEDQGYWATQGWTPNIGISGGGGGGGGGGGAVSDVTGQRSTISGVAQMFSEKTLDMFDQQIISVSEHLKEQLEAIRDEKQARLELTAAIQSDIRDKERADEQAMRHLLRFGPGGGVPVKGTQAYRDYVMKLNPPKEDPISRWDQGMQTLGSNEFMWNLAGQAGTGLASGQSGMEVFAQTLPMIGSAFGPPGMAIGSILGAVLGNLGTKRADPIMEPIPVKVVNWADMMSQMLKVTQSMISNVAGSGIDTIANSIRVKQAIVGVQGV